MQPKRLLLNSAFILLTATLATGCKEKISGIDFGSAIATDTTYTTTVEAPQWRRVLIEEFTGVSCPPCPKGHLALEGIVAAHHNGALNIDSVSVIGIQATGIPQADPVNSPPYVTRHDNRTPDGSEIYNAVYGTFGNIPRAGIDRVAVGGALSLPRDIWATTVISRLRVPAPVNISLSSTYNDATRQAIVKVRIAYTAPVTKPQNLNIALVENDIIDMQKNDLVIDSMYRHEHVLRDMITLASGTPIMANLAVKEPGRVYERTFIYSVDAAFVPQNCKLIAFVTNNDGADKEVLQVAETGLK